jgi:putative peptidoglycan lipid II flippase
VSSQPPSEAVPGTGPDRPHGRRLARNTAIFSALTGVSRVAGLVREVVASSYFGTSGAFSAFTLAFQVPNLIRALVADAALSSAFVPVFSDLLEHKRRKEALQLASALAGLLLVVLGAISLLFIWLAPVVIPVFTGDEFTDELDALTVGLSKVLFPIIVLLGINGLTVGILNAHDQFTIPAIAPLVWNVVIIAGLVALTPLFEGDDRVYAYAIGVVAGTLVQLLMTLPQLRKLGFPIWRIRLPRRDDPLVRRVLVLMLPVSVGLGLINIDLVLNSMIGSLVSDEAPAAIDKAFRVYMLPQGMFSVAVATVVFPQLSRLASRSEHDQMRVVLGIGMRQIALLLVPAAAATIVLARPIVEVLYQRGEFDAESTDLVTTALAVFAISLPLSGWNLILTRTFFSLQRPWLPTTLAIGSLAVNVAVSLALYPIGIEGVVLGTVVSNGALTALLAFRLRHELHGLEGPRLLRSFAAMLLAAAALAVTAYGVHSGLDSLLGEGLIAQIVALAAALAAGGAVYGAIVLALRLPEARQILDLLRGRMGGRAS